MDQQLTINKAGVDWLMIKAWLLGERDKVINVLIAPGTTPDMTNFARGKVAQIDELIAAAEPPKTPEAEDTRDYA